MIEELQKYDVKFYEDVITIHKKLYGEEVKNSIRNDITHNMSSLFSRFIPHYKDNKTVGWKVEKELDIEDALQVIETIFTVLKENLDILTIKLSEKFPPKGTKEYNDKCKKIENKLKKKGLI